MLQHDLAKIELLIQENIKSYREQLHKETNVLSTSLKLEIENIRSTLQNRIDSIIYKLEQKLDQVLEKKEKIAFSNLTGELEYIKNLVKVNEEKMLKIESLLLEKNKLLELQHSELEQVISKDIYSLKHCIDEQIKLFFAEHLENFKHKEKHK